MIITIAGTGTSHGVPVIACTCETCRSTDPKDTRLRTSAFIKGEDGTQIVIDTSPEFRIQALRYKLTKLDALFITHTHADHIHGLDDVRIFTFEKILPVYSHTEALIDIKNRFDYIFKETPKGGGKPRLNLIDCAKYNAKKTIIVGNLQVVPIPLLHGEQPTTGWRIGKFAYLTDANAVPESSLELLQGLEHVVIDGLREREHITHFNFEQAIEAAACINAKHTWITHLCHDFSHKAATKKIAELAQEKGYTKPILPAYDGLEIQCS